MDQIFMLHCDPTVDVGRIGLREGPLTGAADRLEVRLLAERKYLAAVGEHLVDGEIEALVSLLHLRPVERAASAVHADAPARRALAGGMLDALLEHEHAAVLELPTRRRVLNPRQGAVHLTVSSRPNRTDMTSRTWARPATSFSTTVSF